MERVQSDLRPYFPTVAERAWWAFWELDAARSFTVGMAAVYQPIGHHGLHHYQMAHGIVLKQWERQAILRMDHVRLKFLNQSPEDRQTEAVEAQPVTPALVKALFG